MQACCAAGVPVPTEQPNNLEAEQAEAVHSNQYTIKADSLKKGEKKAL